MSRTFPVADCRLPEGVPQIGIVCSYCPEEVIYAVGLQPVRLVGSGRPVSRSDAYLHNNLCPFVRGLFDTALAGECDALVGVVFVNSCDAMRRLHDVWRQYGRHEFTHLLDVLRIDTGEAVEYFAEQLRRLTAALANHFGVIVDEERVRAAIALVNRTRLHIADLHALRAAVPAQISGSEAFPILLSGVRSAPSLFQSSLDRYLSGVEATPHNRFRGKPRLLVTGSVVHHPQLVELAEQAGAVVVAEDVCVGYRHYDGPVDEEGDPYTSIARRYIQRLPCARMKDIGRRQSYLGRLIEQFQVDGVIYHALKFCDLYQYDMPPMQQLFERLGIPALYIETDYTTGSYGQLKTRLQAFVEVLV